jgi:ribosomal protein S18 acetylase RimI-like enzyme
MDLIFHKCTINDLDKLVSISKHTFINAFEKDNNASDFKDYINKAFSKKQLKIELLNPDCSFYFAYSEKELIGYFKLNTGTAQNEQFETNSTELERIYVLEAHQNKGLGKQLLFKSINLAKANNSVFLWLGVWEENTDAIKFYQRYNFNKTGTHPYFIGTDKQTDWIMALELDCI